MVSRQNKERLFTVKWKQCPQDAATLFEKLGFNYEVEKRIEGARGAHDICVLVTGSVYDISFRWIVKCKNIGSSPVYSTHRRAAIGRFLSLLTGGNRQSANSGV